MANIPGAVPLTSSRALNNATLPYIQALADKGARAALADDAHLLNGLNVCRGRLTHPEVADDLGIDYTRAEDALELIGN